MEIKSISTKTLVSELARRFGIVDSSFPESSVEETFVPKPVAALTFHQLRKIAIEDAIVDLASRYTTARGGKFDRIQGYHGHNSVEFIVNKEKRTVVCILRLYYTPSNTHVWKGIAKCDPSDVFNVHLGKIIALYRALGEEVPEKYLTAPQPTEFEVGDIITFKAKRDEGLAIYRIDNLKGYDNLTILKSRNYSEMENTKAQASTFEWAKILDDSKE